MLATGVNHLASHDTVYTRKLLRRGIDLDEPGDVGLHDLMVSAVMVDPPAGVEDRVELRAAAAIFATTGVAALPVTDARGSFLGVLTSRDVMEALAADEDLAIAAIMRPDRVRVDSPVRDALHELDRGADAVAVTTDDGRLVGWVRHRDVLVALASRPVSTAAERPQVG